MPLKAVKTVTWTCELCGFETEEAPARSTAPCPRCNDGRIGSVPPPEQPQT